MIKVLFLLLLFLKVNLFAMSPYSTENIKNVNIKLIDKEKILNENQKEFLLNEIKTQVVNAGIKTSSEEFSNMLFKIESLEVNKKEILHITFRIVEDIIPKRDTSLEAIAITYMKSDLFEVEEDKFKEIKSSIIKYLLAGFLKQYKEEN